MLLHIFLYTISSPFKRIILYNSSLSRELTLKIRPFNRNNPPSVPASQDTHFESSEPSVNSGWIKRFSSSSSSSLRSWSDSCRTSLIIALFFIIKSLINLKLCAAFWYWVGLIIDFELWYKKSSKLYHRNFFYLSKKQLIRKIVRKNLFFNNNLFCYFYSAIKINKLNIYNKWSK